MPISQEDIESLRKQGLNNTQIEDVIREYDRQELERAYEDTKNSYNDDPRAMSQQSSFVSHVDDNLIKWQLELNDILERAEHILRGDVPKYERGVMIWGANKNPDANPLNETGIHEIMKILAMYINRNTILSDYEKNEINAKVFDFGRRINNFIFMRYDEIGMITEEKRKIYDLLVGELVDLVHSAFNRALHGGERRSLREMIQVSQSYRDDGQGNIMMGGGKERGILNPMRYIKGKVIPT